MFNKLWRKFVRKDAPQTSVEAAQYIDVNKMEKTVLEAIQSYPDGCIQDDVLDRLDTYAYSSVTARFSSLFRKGLIGYTGEVRRGRSGRSQRVMKAL